MDYDVIIVGAGPAGLSAGLTAAYLKMKTLVLEAVVAGGLLSHNYPWKEVDGYLGFKGLHGKEMAVKLVDHIKKEGVKLKEGVVVQEIKPGFEIITDKGKFKAKTVILAVGCMGCYRKLGVPGDEKEGVFYCLKDPKKEKGKRVLVVGGGDSAVETAINLQNAGATATIIHRKEEFRANEKNQGEIKKSGVQILLNTEMKEVMGSKVEKAKLINNKTQKEMVLPVDEVFVCIGSIPNHEFFEKIGVKVDDDGNLVVDPELRTSQKGMFAAGDVTGGLKRISWAVGEGSKAAFSAFKFIKNPYWK